MANNSFLAGYQHIGGASLINVSANQYADGPRTSSLGPSSSEMSFNLAHDAWTSVLFLHHHDELTYFNPCFTYK